MKLNQNFFSIFTTIAFGFLFFTTQAQPFPAPCVDEDFPRIKSAPVDGYDNKIMFWLEWSNAVNACYKPIPDPWVYPADQAVSETIKHAPQPQWVIYWEFGDGFYSSGFQDTVFHVYGKAETFDVSARITPTYSPNDPPPARISTVDITNIDTIPNNTNFSPNDFGEYKLEPYFDAAALGDTLIWIVSYRNQSATETRSGEVSINLPLTGINLLMYRGDIDTQKSNQTKSSHEVLRWSTGNVPPQTERTFFVDLKLADDYEGDNLTLSGGLKWQEGKSIPELLGLNQDNGATTDNPDGIESSDAESVKVNKSRDPNNIEVDKYIIPPSENTTQFLTYTINFQNLGTAPADKIILHSFLDSKLDETKLFTLNHFPKNANINLVEPDDPTNNKIIPSWTMTPIPPGREHVLAHPAEAFTVDSIETKGFVQYSIQTKNIPLVEGDKIAAYALIQMDTDSLVTDTIYTLVQSPKDITLPWYVGIKAGLNIRDTVAATGLSGFHAGLTFRKAFGKVKGQPATSTTLWADLLPEFWFQAELLASNMNYTTSLGDDYNFWYLNIPLMIRYVPNIWQRKLALSGGYGASFQLTGKVNGSTPGLGDFGDRLEHNLFLDVAYFNILGSPGLSVGFRANKRSGNLLGNPQNYWLYQPYVHYTF